MSAAVLLSAHLVSSRSHAAEQSAVLASAELGAVFGTVDSASNSNKSAQAEFRITTPVTSVFGASLHGLFSQTNIQIDMPTDIVGSTSCSYETLGGTGTLFARRPSLGRVSAGITTTRLDSKCDDRGSFLTGNSGSLRSEGYSLGIEYYLPSLTISAERTVTSFGDDSERVTDLLSASWYPMADLSVSPSAGRVGGRTQYGISVEHQPDFLGRSASVSLAFSDLGLDAGSIRTLNLSFTYHFGTHVDLKTRDRQYR